MRIGIYDPYLDSLSGGEKYMLTAASCLSLSNEVSIFWDDKDIKEKAISKLNIDLSHVRIKKNIFSSGFSPLKRIIESKNYDLILILSDGSLPISLLSKTIIHFQFPVEWVRGDSLMYKIKLLKVNNVICNSYFTKKFIDKKFKIQSNILYPPCVDDKYLDEISGKNILSLKKNVILTVGRYSPLPEGGNMKKFDIMINTFKKMVDSGLLHWEFVLLISCLKENEPRVTSLKKITQGYPVKIISNCGYRQLLDHYINSKIYWHAAGFGEDLDKNPERAEHFGITTVEAMAHKSVPVVFSAGGQPEIVTDNITGYLWETEDELAEKTKKLMIDEKLRESLAELAFAKAKQFTTLRFCEKLKQILTPDC